MEKKRTYPSILRSRKKDLAKTRQFKALEDTNDLSFLEAIAAEGTHKAYIKAIEVSDMIVEVRDGYLIREQKDGSRQIISQLDHRREVQKGKTVILPHG